MTSELKDTKNVQWKREYCIEKLKHIIMVLENYDGVKVGVRLILLYDHGISYACKTRLIS